MKKGIVSLQAQRLPSMGRRTRLLEAFRKHRFLLAAFLIPLGIRAIPEILVGPYPVGWDTIAYYVPNTIDIAGGKFGLYQILGMAPLLYAISVPIYSTLASNPIWTFKIMGPVLYGLLSWAMFRFLGKSLAWPANMAFLGSLVSALYFVTLRIGWDMYRTLLGLTFILLSIPLLESRTTLRNQLLLSLLIFLVVASDQLTGAVALFLVTVTIVLNIHKSRIKRAIGLVALTLPSIVLFSLAIAYSGAIVSGGSIIQTQSLTPDQQTITSSLGFLAYAYFLIAPLAIYGYHLVRSRYLAAWSTFCLAGVVSALLPIIGLNIMSYRWSLLLDLPLCVYAVAGLARLTTERSEILTHLRIPRIKILAVFLFLLVTVSSIYLV